MSVRASPSFASRLGRFTTLNVGQQVALIALSLVATPVLYHRLGETAYGILAIVTLLASQLAILEFGFGHATIRWVAQCRARRDDGALGRTLGTSAWVFAGTAAVGGGILLIAAEPLVEGFFNVPGGARATAVTAVRVGSLFFVASVFGNLASSVWQGIQRFGALNLISGVASALQILGSLAIVVAGHGVVAVVVWSTALGFLTLAVNLVGLRRALPGIRGLGRPDGGTLKEMGRFGFLLMLAGALTQVVISGGPLVLGHFVAIGALPFFTVPFGLYQRLNRMAYGLAGALFPLVSELQGRRDDQTLEKVFVSGTRTLLLVGAAAMAPAVLVAAPFLSLWMGPDFAAQAGTALEMLFVAFAFALASIPSIELARGTGRAGLLVGYTATQAAVTVVGIALLASGRGAEGAALAFLAAQVAGFAFLTVKVGGRAFRRVLTPGPVLVLSAGSGAVLGALVFVEGPWSRLVLAAGLAVALAAAALFALDAPEREALRRMMART
ncbi:MAG TPA: oligosaccharide flippase family protein [Longimicrobiales bacterium]|nr:oligosaccharide flippase family protein [Longimicrobiales bacterium]